MRLRRSIGLLGFDLETSDDLIRARIDECLSFASNDESYLRVIVTRGVGDMSYRFERIAGPTMAIYVKPLEPVSETLYDVTGRRWKQRELVSLGADLDDPGDDKYRETITQILLIGLGVGIVLFLTSVQH